MSDPRWRGIQRHGSGWRASVSCGRGRPPIRQHFPLDTPPETMQAWRRDTQDARRLERKQRAYAGTFEADAKRYLKAVAALPTIRHRKREIQVWVDIFGTTQRDRIRASDIRAVRDRWLTEPRSSEDTRPLAAGTINKRLRALSNLFRVLDGSHRPNPARDVPEVAEPDPIPRALSYDAIDRILAALPDLNRAEKGKTRGTVSHTKIRLRCLGYCQITPGQFMSLTPADLDLAHERIRLPSRKKGRGAKAIWVTLSPQAVAAFTAFQRANLFGTFSQSAMRKSFKSAAIRAGFNPPPRVYDLRHSYGTAAYRATGSLEATGRLLQHAQRRTTERYTLEAEAQALAESSALVGRHIGLTRQGDTRKQAETGGQPIALVKQPMRGKSRRHAG